MKLETLTFMGMRFMMTIIFGPTRKCQIYFTMEAFIQAVMEKLIGGLVTKTNILRLIMEKIGSGTKTGGECIDYEK